LQTTHRAKANYKVTASHVIRLLFLLALPLAISSPGSAASLTGKVTEVFDGASLVVTVGNHAVKVRLIGVAPLEKNQPYADIARQHLSDLVLNKNVMVQYSLLRDGYLVGQVMFGPMDVGAQMIRDGVAWYDKSEASDARRLVDTDQQIYAASQEAAHNEHRGLWQDARPVSPWEFRKAQLEAQLAAQRATVSKAPPAEQERAHLTRGTKAGLTSEDLMGGLLGPGELAGKPNARPVFSEAVPGRWMKYQPAAGNFSVRIPSDAYEISAPVVDPEGKIMNLNYVVARDGQVLYFLMWAKGPNENYTNASITDKAITSFLLGMNSSTQRAGITMSAEPSRNVSLSGYTGKEFAVSGGAAKGVVRVLSKQIGNDRELYLQFVLGPDGEPTGDEFLSSFKIGSSPSK
jgi:endonuclease YncB( thermonuclease family)